MCESGFIFRYRVRNWRQYNRALVRRGSITFWIDEQAVRSWCSERMPGARGRPQLYADTAIECALVVKAVFHLSLRSTQGFLESLVQLMGVDLPLPDYTNVCKRQRDLRVQLGATPAAQPRIAQRKLAQPNAAATLEFLRVPPGNRLEALKGDRRGQYSVRINDQWRLCFRFDDGNAYDVEIVDYH